MISKKHLLPISMALSALLFTPVPILADFGSKHDKNRVPKNARKGPRPSRQQPFDFSEIFNTVQILEAGAVERHLGGHLEQSELEAMDPIEAYVHAFEEGDELFEMNYNALDGVGVNVGNGKRFTSFPRPDLKGPMAWANILPHRTTGPNGDSCISCHNVPVADGGGGVNDNVIRMDPERKQKGFIERQSPHLFGMGAVQLVAEEMTTELHTLRDDAISESCNSGESHIVKMITKGVNFGEISVSCGNVNYDNLDGIDTDLVVRPFEWKGLTGYVRAFVRGAAHQELGMQATELVGDADSDFDSVTNELSVGDITALAIYNAAQPRPVTKLELNSVISTLSEEEQEIYGLPLSEADIAGIQNGEVIFNSIDCASCHSPEMEVASPIFYEPSKHASFRDETYPAGDIAGLPTTSLQFNLLTDILDNPQELASGQTLGQFEESENGGAIVRLYGDLKRHDMGRAMAEEFDEGNVGASVFLTENLWGVGSTAPYLHDGRATTMTEAILYHGGEAQSSKEQFDALSDTEKADLLSFLNNLVLYLAPE
ncbi:di-heme oxidoredictase family protein [Microbulbifer sp. MLAF003]|uniref:di-heme oxidoredictase family protein n=1 Tax=Microbulbifer sp. MLAF003 TaxID=3032582 RepID=UPI0024AD688E|nr:di-heme oxidoredictase family protein [Microbulbifer sp. MLAF003]WHI50351.1 di-heme oxidoredictase family protein [Microbulbifer sp. MLAF003]